MRVQTLAEFVVGRLAATPESTKGWIVSRPLVGAVLATRARREGVEGERWIWSGKGREGGRERERYIEEVQ